MQDQDKKSIIVVKNLKKTYAGKVPTPVLKGVYMLVHEGEYVAIMGRSGSGKSTLLNQLCLLDEANEGEILIDKVDVTKLSERKKTQYRLEHFGYVFQEYALLPEFTALETVAMPLMLLHKPKKEYMNTAREMLTAVGLEHRIHHYPSELSGGEQQRVAIARAIANQPRILFADEPCANLDSESSEEIISIFKRFNKELKQTIVMITHEPEDRKHVERVIWIKDGIATSE